MTFIPAYKPGQQFDSRWREEPPEDDHVRECFECGGCREGCDDWCPCICSPECEGGCGPRCACAYDRRDKMEDER